MNSNVTTALEAAARFRGIYTRVGKKLGLSSQHVREVALGRRVSSRVVKALDREFQRIEAKQGERAA